MILWCIVSYAFYGQMQYFRIYEMLRAYLCLCVCVFYLIQKVWGVVVVHRPSML